MDHFRNIILLGAIALAAVGMFAAGSPPKPTSASHGPSNPSWVHVRAPFTGYWDKFGYASPSSHSVGYWGGDWATDFYKTEGAEGKWYASSSSGSGITAEVDDRRNTCNKSSWEDAGISYKIGLTDSSGYLGWFSWNHVHAETGSGSGYMLGFGASLTNGMLIGTTYLYDEQSGCWEVDNDGGTHWHIVGWNDHNWSCYYPHTSGNYPWSYGDILSQQSDVLGAVGANATGTGESCW